MSALGPNALSAPENTFRTYICRIAKIIYRMDKYFGMNKVAVRQRSKVERAGQLPARRGNKILYFVSYVCIAALFAACVYLEKNVNSVLSEIIRVFVLLNI